MLLGMGSVPAFGVSHFELSSFVTRLCIKVYNFIRTRAGACVHIYMYVCMCVYIYVCMCMCMYVCVCVYIFGHTETQQNHKLVGMYLIKYWST
jgi:hypothetical protein